MTEAALALPGTRIATGTPRPEAARVHEHSKPKEIPKLTGVAPRENFLVWQEPYHSQLETAVKDPGVSVILLAAGTGTGKTRCGVEIALEALGKDGKMVVTENLSRVTEKSAEVAAYDMKVPLGEDVGVRNRRTHEFSDQTRLLFCPVQSLLIMMEDDPLLERYNMIAMDEVHKETKANELCMVRLAQIQKERIAKGKPPLKLMFISATADKEKITGYFGKENVREIEVPGKNFDIDVKFRKKEEPEIPLKDIPQAAAQKVRESIASGDKGNIVVFLSGKGEIEEAAKSLRDLSGVKIVTYYGGASKEEQDKLFANTSERLVVLATNAIQEGVTARLNIVIDGGTHKHTVFDPATGRHYLVEEKAPQDHLIQRRGRIGRNESPFPGQNDKYYALFTEDDFNSRPPHEAAEIQRTDLTQEMLILMAQGHDVYSFHYLNQPPREHIDSALRRLTAIGALKDGQLTPKGSLMAKLQVNPNNASMVVSGADNGALRETAALASMLETYNDALNSENKAAARFRNPQSDVLGYIKLFNEFHSMPDAAQQKRWASTNGLKYDKLQDAEKMYQEIIRVIKSRRPGIDAVAAGSARAFDKSILEGFADSLIHRAYSKTYTMDMGNASMKIWRDSVLKEQKPHHFVSLKIEPFLEGSTITGHSAGLNHIIPDDIVTASGFKSPEETPAPGPAGEISNESASVPSSEPVPAAEKTTTDTAPAPLAASEAESHSALPVTPGPPRRRIPLREQVGDWLGNTWLGSIWRRMTRR